MRVAVVGCGSAGMRHLTVMRDHLGVAAVAIPTRSERIPELEAAGFIATHNLAQAGQIDAVIIATDTAKHVSDALAAFQADIPWILVEKPVSCSQSEVSELVRMAPGLLNTTFVAYNLRFSPSIASLRSTLGVIGRVYAADIICRSYLPFWRPGRDYRATYATRIGEGGALRDLSHEIDYAVWLFGRPNDRGVFASIGHTGLLDIPTEDCATLIWSTVDGAQVSIRIDYLAKPPVRKMSVYGSLGTAEWDAGCQTVDVAIPDEPPLHSESKVAPITYTVEQDREFLSIVSGAAGERLTTLREAMTTVAICDAA